MALFLLRSLRTYCSAHGYCLAVDFEDHRVQNYIKQLNGMDFNKIYAERIGEAQIPQFNLLSEEMVKKVSTII